jgi:hypothetical protein
MSVQYKEGRLSENEERIGKPTTEAHLKTRRPDDEDEDEPAQAPGMPPRMIWMWRARSSLNK